MSDKGGLIERWLTGSGQEKAATPKQDTGDVNTQSGEQPRGFLERLAAKASPAPTIEQATPPLSKTQEIQAGMITTSHKKDAGIGMVGQEIGSR